jgi:hypothetical protein
MMTAVHKDRRWVDALDRLVQSGRLDADLAKRIRERLTSGVPASQ